MPVPGVFGTVLWCSRHVNFGHKASKTEGLDLRLRRQGGILFYMGKYSDLVMRQAFALLFSLVGEINVRLRGDLLLFSKIPDES